MTRTETNTGIARTEIMMMSKLTLPDWTRWAWISYATREWYHSRFKRIPGVLHELDLLAVQEGLRPAAWQFVSADNLVPYMQRLHGMGLVGIPTDRTTQDPNSSYSSIGAKDGVLTYRLLITTPDRYTQAISFGSDREKGVVLGYPTCCRQHFDATWGKGQVDSTWEQQLGAPKTRGISHTLWRHMGIRLVPWMPCSFNCEESNEFAAKFTILGVKHGYQEDMALIHEVLRWPVEWSRLFGISQLVSPALRFTSRTDFTAEKQTFSYEGDYTPITDHLWTDNGFNSADGQEDRHNALILSLKEALRDGTRICDLGCGNGLLLRRLKTHYRKDLKICGVDLNADAISRIPFGSGKWSATRIQDGVWREWLPQAVLISLPRFRELSAEDYSKLHAWLAEIPQVFLYAYDDHMQRGEFPELVEAAGFDPNKVAKLVQTENAVMGIVTAK